MGGVGRAAGVSECGGCGADVSHLSRRFRYCSNACRRWVANGHTDRRPTGIRCVQCGASVSGRMATARYCSKICKSRAVEARRVRDDAGRYQQERARRIEYATAYAKRNPHVGQAAKRRRRAQAANAGVFAFSSGDWLRLQRRLDFRCVYCGERRPLSMDHVVPLIRGGRHSIGNIVPACMPCNASKNGRYITEWRSGRSWHRERG